MVNFIEEKTGKNGKTLILNGRASGDEEGEFTFIGYRGNSVIDYIIVSEKMWERIVKLTVEERMDSDHTSVSVTMLIGEKNREIQRKTMISVEKKEILSWS